MSTTTRMPVGLRAGSLGTIQPDGMNALLGLARRLHAREREPRPCLPLRGRNVAALHRDPHDPAARILHEAAVGLGARVVHPDWTAIGLDDPDAAPLARTAGMLGRFYDAIDAHGAAPRTRAALVAGSGVPVFDGLGAAAHPARLLGLLLACESLAGRPLEGLRLCVRADLRAPQTRELLRLADLARIVVDVAGSLDAAVGTTRCCDLVLESPTAHRWTIRDAARGGELAPAPAWNRIAIQTLLLAALGA